MEKVCIPSVWCSFECVYVRARWFRSVYLISICHFVVIVVVCHQHPRFISFFCRLLLLPLCRVDISARLGFKRIYILFMHTTGALVLRFHFQFWIIYISSHFALWICIAKSERIWIFSSEIWSQSSTVVLPSHTVPFHFIPIFRYNMQWTLVVAAYMDGQRYGKWKEGKNELPVKKDLIGWAIDLICFVFVAVWQLARQELNIAPHS